MTHLVRARRHTPAYVPTTGTARAASGDAGVQLSAPGGHQAVYDALSDIVCITTFDGTLRFVNRAGRELLGYMHEDAALLGLVLPTHTPAARELFLEEIIPATLRHGRATGDTALQTADGRVFPAAQTVIVTPHHIDAPMTLTIIIRDVSIERQTSKRLAESQRLFEMIARTSPDLMYLYDPADERVVWTNRCPHAFLGGAERDARTLSRREIARLVHRDDLQQLRNAAARIASAYGDSDTVTAAVRLRSRGGTWRWIQTRTTVFSRRETGAPLLILGVATDIGALKKTEARLIAARESAERANQDKHTFVTRLANELHRGLDTVLGLLSEMRANRDGRLTIRETEQLAQAADRTVHMRSTISDLTDYTRMESGEAVVHQAPCDIPSLICETIAAFAEHPRVKAAAVMTVLPAGVAPALVDHARLRQALTHVLGHVLAFSGDEHVVVRLVTDDDAGAPLAIVVEDPGAHRDPTRQHDLFSPFTPVTHSAHIERPGSETGLGLALTRAICEMIGCRLECVSLDVGSGSAFRITLPVISRNARLAVVDPSAAALIALGNVTDGQKVIPLV